MPEIGSRSAAERLLTAGSVRVDGSARPKSYRLEGGEEVEVELPAEAPKTLEPEQVDFRVAYEDEHLLIVDKPAGLVVHPGAGHGSGTLVHGLVGGPGVGRQTGPGSSTGSTVTPPGSSSLPARTRPTSGFRIWLRSREVERHYLALVRGRPRSWRGRIEAPIGRDRDDPTRQSLNTDTPREAVTHFEVAELLGGNALLDVRLETGRTHQIRVHLAAVDLPVIGDPVYGVPDQTLGRQFLHAGRLAFDHPFTNDADRRRIAASARAGRLSRPIAGQRLESSDLVTVPAGRSGGGAARRAVPPARRRLNCTQTTGGSILSVVTMRELLEAGVHFGHQTRRWDPKMRRFIFGERGGIYIIDLEQTLQLIEEAAAFARNVGERGGTCSSSARRSRLRTQSRATRSASACRT